MQTISERIAAFSSSLQWDDLPKVVQEKSKVTLLHNLGVALAGIPLADTAKRYAIGMHEKVDAESPRMLMNGQRASIDTAALVNSALMHARAQDDVYFPGLTHSGSAMTPAVLAVGESIRASGKDMLVALVAGSEACAAICQHYGVASAQKGFRPTGVFGVFASVVAVTKLLNLDAVRTAHAIGIAASAGSGVAQPWVSSSQEWQFQIAMACRNGILAARLAEAGLTGARDAIEGRAGFYRAFTGSADGSEMVATDLGKVWRSLDVTYKPFPVCAILQGPVSGAIEVATKHCLRSDEIRAVRLHLNPVEAAIPGTDTTGPYSDTGSTLMSAQFCLSVALSKGTVQGSDLKRFQDAELAQIIQKTEVIPDASLGVRSYKLVVERCDGSAIEHIERVVGEPFNWSRDETISNLKRISDELPFTDEGFSCFIECIMNADLSDASKIMDSCLMGHK